MALQTIPAWLLQIGVTAIPGIIHQWLAARELEADLEHFPAFNPYRSPRYWTLRIFFFALPVILFWTLIPLIFRVEPPSAERSLWNWTLWGMAIALGLHFESVLSASLSIASAGVLDFGPLYEGVVKTFRKTMLKNEAGKTQVFWAEVAQDLDQSSAQTNQQNYRDGHRYLSDMLTIRQNAEEEDTRLGEISDRLKKVLPGTFRRDPRKETLSLLEWLVTEKLISRQQLPIVLSKFGCHQCIHRYFPKAPQGSRSPS